MKRLGTLAAPVDPAAGASVSTSLSSQTATTNASGFFTLDTGVTALAASRCQTYSVSISASPAFGITNPQILNITLGPSAWGGSLSMQVVLSGHQVSPTPAACM